MRRSPGPGQPVIAGRDAIRAFRARSVAGGHAARRFVQARAETGSDRAAMAPVWEATIQPQGASVQGIRGRSPVRFTQTPQGWLISADVWQPAPYAGA